MSAAIQGSAGQASREFLFQLAQKFGERESHRFADRAQLEHVQSSLARFVFAHERLGHLEAVGEISLRQPGRNTDVFQQLAQLPMLVYEALFQGATD